MVAIMDFFYVRKNGRYEQVRYSELIFVKALRGYMQLVTESQVYFVLNTIEEVQRHLPSESFCRTHRSYIVAKNRIKAFDNTTIYLHAPTAGKTYGNGLARAQELPLGKAFRKKIREQVRIIPNRMGQKTRRIREAEFMLEFDLLEE